MDFPAGSAPRKWSHPSPPQACINSCPDRRRSALELLGSDRHVVEPGSGQQREAFVVFFKSAFMELSTLQLEDHAMRWPEPLGSVAEPATIGPDHEIQTDSLSRDQNFHLPPRGSAPTQQVLPLAGFGVTLGGRLVAAASPYGSQHRQARIGVPLCGDDLTSHPSGMFNRKLDPVYGGKIPVPHQICIKPAELVAHDRERGNGLAADPDRVLPQVGPDGICHVFRICAGSETVRPDEVSETIELVFRSCGWAGENNWVLPGSGHPCLLSGWVTAARGACGPRCLHRLGHSDSGV